MWSPKPPPVEVLAPPPPGAEVCLTLGGGVSVRSFAPAPRVDAEFCLLLVGPDDPSGRVPARGDVAATSCNLKGGIQQGTRGRVQGLSLRALKLLEQFAELADKHEIRVHGRPTVARWERMQS